MNKRYSLFRKILIFWTLFIGIGAIGGSMCMFIDPSGKMFGMDEMLPFFQVLPFADVLFQNLLFSGIALLIVNGISNMIAFALLITNRKSGVVLGTVFGITLMLWIIIQFVVFPPNFMSIIFFIFGFLQFVAGVFCYVGFEQSKFTFNEKDYENIGGEGKTAVVYFSRTGYTKKLAYELADRTGADLIEIKTTERINGDLGFWWCGRFGMHRWGMPLEKSEVDFSKYEKVTICTPVWVFSTSAPVREFCKIQRDKISNVDYVVVSFLGGRFNNVATEMDKLLNVKHGECKFYRCRYGKIKER